MRDGSFEAVSLFTGAGGLDIGIERAGFNVVAANDSDKSACATLRANQVGNHRVAESSVRCHLDGTKIIERDLGKLSGQDFIPAGARESWRPDVLVGGPPCQTFSSAGSQRALADPRGLLFHDFVRIADELRPKLILFENVRGLVTARGPSGAPGEAINLIRQAFESIGYATSFRLLNSADYGAPQRRVRLFMFGAAPDATLPQFPEPTHGRNGGLVKPWVTLGEFLSGRPRPRESEIVRPSPTLLSQLEILPDGSGLRSPGRPEPTRPGGHWGYKQGTFIADLALPARTVTGAATQDWVRCPATGLRRITLREAAAIQGFPNDWVFYGSKSAQFQQIGNAVPVIFGDVLGMAMREALRTPTHHKATSVPFPEHMRIAINYAARDDARNGVARPRSPRYKSPRTPGLVALF